MASIISASIDLTKIDKNKIYEGKKGKYYPLTIVLNDEVGQYGDSGYVQTEQTKEERDAKLPKTFLGNTKVVWTNGQNVAPVPRDGDQGGTTQNPMHAAPQSPDLPF
jgi:hypothetical protein|tara:strand:- start:529 stop:849 length:321 start_codon:yes stop_codon:yes gene_type:complete